MCNDKIKFSLLDLLAGEIAADYMGTGHYARVHYDESNREYQLLRGVDESRDQSYFLFRLGQNRLRRTLFPLGELRKQEVREILRAAQIGTPNKPESRELCFVENDLYAEFVEQQVQEKLKTRIRSGKIVNEAGETLGTHDGIHRFTVGQRKGIGIAAPEPLYVTRIDGENHTVVVGNKTAAYQDHCVVETVNWISEASRFPTDLQVQLRYRGTPIEAKIEQLSEHSNDHSSGASYRLQFQDKSHLPTPGQAAVFYDGERVLGGGWIA
jgi:tRNA-specific 2-thiouridylase